MNILKTIFLQIWVSGATCLSPLQIQRSRVARNVVMVSRHSYKWRCWKFWRLIIMFFAVCMAVRVVHTVFTGKGKVNVASFLLLMMWTTFSMGTHWSQTNIASRTEEIPLLVNSVILFQKKHGIVVKDDLTNLVTLFLVIGASLCPFTIPLLSLATPCSPQYLGNVILDCSNPENLSLQSRLWIYTVETTLITGAAMSTSILSNLIVALAGMLNSYIRYVRDTKCFLVHHTSKRQRYVNSQAAFYRQFQLLIKLYNATFQHHHLPNIRSCSAVIIGSLFGTIQLHGKVPITGYVAFPLLCINCVIILFGTIHLCSCATLSSISLKNKWRAKNYFGSNWLRIFARSCPDIKIRIGPFHEIRRQQLAIVYKFCLQRTFFLIVCSRKP